MPFKPSGLSTLTGRTFQTHKRQTVFVLPSKNLVVPYRVNKVQLV